MLFVRESSIQVCSIRRRIIVSNTTQTHTHTHAKLRDPISSGAPSIVLLSFRVHATSMDPHNTMRWYPNSCYTSLPLVRQIHFFYIYTGRTPKKKLSRIILLKHVKNICTIINEINRYYCCYEIHIFHCVTVMKLYTYQLYTHP